jgi:hypothetical protein
MTNDRQRADQPEFKVDDEIDLLFGRANPNPSREGCPPSEVLLALSRRERPMEDPAYEHLAKCSPCFREFRAFQQADGVTRAITARSRLRWTVAAAAVILLAVIGAWSARRRSSETIVPGPAVAGVTAEQTARLDLRPYAATRSDERRAEPDPLVVPRGRVSATILLPVGSEPGEYEVRVLDGNLESRASAKTTATIRNFVTTLEAKIDVGSLPPGGYRLAVRRQGGEWQMFPAQVR